MDARAELKTTTTDVCSTPLHFKAQNGDAEFVRLLLEAGAEKDAIQQDGTTALYIAAKVEVVQLLLEFRADQSKVSYEDFDAIARSSLLRTGLRAASPAGGPGRSGPSHKRCRCATIALGYWSRTCGSGSCVSPMWGGHRSAHN